MCKGTPTMSSRMRKLNSRFSVLILLVPLLCNLALFSQVAYAEAKNALISNLPAKIENGLLDAIEDTGQVSLPDVIGAGARINHISVPGSPSGKAAVLQRIFHPTV